MTLRFTGHPFVDAGVAAIAALLEDKGVPAIGRPEDITSDYFQQAVELMKDLYLIRICKDEKTLDKMPLLYFLLQEVLPGSSWDQSKAGKDVAGSKETKFLEYVRGLQNAMAAPSIGTCSISGQEAHVWIDKSKMPLLSSGGERPSCYPNLDEGYRAAGWVALSILFSPISIEKTANDRGTGEPGSSCLIYHSPDWRFMVEVAKRNLQRLQLSLSAKSLKEVRYRRFMASNKSKKCFRRGTSKIAFSTILHSMNLIDADKRPQISIWSFNANNQSCRYDCVKISSAFLVIHQNRRLIPSAYKDMPRCSDRVSRAMLEGYSISKDSIIRDEKKRIDKTTLMPGWALQRLYAEKVLKMSPRLLNAIEKAAQHLSQDNQAVSYCLYDSAGRIRPAELTNRYKVPASTIAVFADYPYVWQDYLRAAVLWAFKGNAFGPSPSSVDKAGKLEALLIDIAPRLRQKHSYKRLYQTLSVSVPRHYRAAWIKLLRDGACTWDDFLSFNPLDEALSISNYYHTRIMRDYLIAYLIGCSQQSPADAENDEEADVEDDEIPVWEVAVDDEMEDEL